MWDEESVIEDPKESNSLENKELKDEELKNKESKITNNILEDDSILSLDDIESSMQLEAFTEKAKEELIIKLNTIKSEILLITGQTFARNNMKTSMDLNLIKNERKNALPSVMINPRNRCNY